MSSADAFLWLRYAGVPSIDDIESRGGKFYAYKCKKYAYWDTVHTSSQSKELLLDCFQSLSAGEQLLADNFEEMQRAWLLMQRWRLDKESLAIDPPLLDSYIRLQSIFKIAAANPDFVPSHMTNNGLDADNLEDETLWSVFCAFMLVEFLKSSAKRFGGLQAEIESVKVSLSDWEGGINSANQLSLDIYDRLGYEFESLDADFVAALLGDLDIDSTQPNFAFDRVSKSRQQLDVFVTSGADDKSMLLRFDVGAESTAIKLNSEHVFFKKHPELLDIQNPFYLALGRALQDHVVDEDKIADFITTLGGKLRMLFPK